MTIRAVENPRRELEEHYYNPAHSGLLELGLNLTLMSENVVVSMLEQIMRYREYIDERKVMPRVAWK